MTDTVISKNIDFSS